MKRFRRPITLNDAVSITKKWLDVGGQPKIELGALEPLLWRDGRKRPGDLVYALTKLGANVSMTTNASLLAEHAQELKDAGLRLLRVSWHTTHPNRFTEISGRGNYSEFIEGIETAMNAKLNISFNRVVLRGQWDDLDHHLDLVEGYGTRLKLYDLMWTPEITDFYDRLYQPLEEVISKYLIPRALGRHLTSRHMGRARVRFFLKGGAWVEAKVSNKNPRKDVPCDTCSFAQGCLEAFGDYLRVEPELDLYFCYLRRDFGFSARNLSTDGLRLALAQQLGDRLTVFLRSTTLRFIAVPSCNFNCLVPGTSLSWCHKTTGDYTFPGRPRRQNRVLIVNQ